MARRFGALFLLVTLTALGCQGDPVDSAATADSPPAQPAIIDLASGKVDPSLVGLWKSPEETYRLALDGTFKLHYDRMEQTGPNSRGRKTGDVAGRWSLADQALLLEVNPREKHRMSIAMHENGKIMELRPTFMKKGQGTLYRRAG